MFCGGIGPPRPIGPGAGLELLRMGCGGVGPGSRSDTGAGRPFGTPCGGTEPGAPGGGGFFSAAFMISSLGK